MDRIRKKNPSNTKSMYIRVSALILPTLILSESKYWVIKHQPTFISPIYVKIIIIKKNPCLKSAMAIHCLICCWVGREQNSPYLSLSSPRGRTINKGLAFCAAWPDDQPRAYLSPFYTKNRNVWCFLLFQLMPLLAIWFSVTLWAVMVFRHQNWRC